MPRKINSRNNGITEKEIEEFSNFLKKVRSQLNYSLEKMGRVLEVHHTTVSRWERGKYSPNQEMYLLEEKMLNVLNKKGMVL